MVSAHLGDGRELFGYEGFRIGALDVVRTHRDRDAERLEATVDQCLDRGGVEAGRRRLVRWWRAAVPAGEAIGELLPAAFDELPEFRVLGEDLAAQVSAVGDVASLVALGELDPRFEAGKLTDPTECLVPALVTGDRRNALDEARS